MSSSTPCPSVVRQPPRWQDPTDWVMANYPWTLPPAAASILAVSESLSSSADSSCSSALGGGRPLSLLRLRPEDLGFFDTIHGGSGRGDVGPDATNGTTRGRQQVEMDWDDRGADSPGTETTNGDAYQAMHDGSGEDDVTMTWQQNTSIAFDPLVGYLTLTLWHLFRINK